MGGGGSPPGTTGDANDRDMDRIGFTDERSVGCTGGTRVWSKPSVRRRDGFGDVLNK